MTKSSHKETVEKAFSYWKVLSYIKSDLYVVHYKFIAITMLV